ncbi:phenylalanyl-tRNA synthetase subunit beta, partial [Klebsiella pneumoniae]|nr:phenylalanyl-tRNA synthetase subunit beta [Klebsiella pneumoniae]
YANGNSDRVILRAVKNGDAPELKILMTAMGLIPEEEDNSEKTA